MNSDTSEDPNPDETRRTEVIQSRIGAPAASQGELLKGRYLIERELGRGGIGVVYLARDERLHSMPVVIKFLLDASGKSSWLTKKFQQEAEALTRINHPAVVRVIDRDTTEGGQPFFVMEFVSGRPLRAVITSQGMNLDHAARLIRQIGSALHAAHQHGVIHRDLKPENILLQSLTGGEEQAKLIDFGIAKVSDSQSGAATEVAVVAGSLQYISPEQLNSQPVSTATDIYALGIIAYEMVTGRRPFEPTAEGYLAAAQQVYGLHENEKFIPPRKLRPELSADAERLISSALKFQPAQRPQDARIFAEDLARTLTGTSHAAPASLAPEQTEVLSVAIPQAQGVPAAGSSKSKMALLAGSLVIAVLLLGAIVWWSPWKGSTPSTSPPSNAEPAAARVVQTFEYSITVQKDPKRYPGSKPFQLPGDVIFSPGDRIRLSINAQAPGYLYIVNESPDGSHNILYPTSAANGGASTPNVASGQQVQIPERGDGFVFDEQQGTEKLWLVWSSSSVPLFESVRRWANAQDKGQIKDQEQLGAIRSFLSKNSEASSTKDEARKVTTVKGAGEVLVKLVRLEHH